MDKKDLGLAADINATAIAKLWIARLPTFLSMGRIRYGKRWM
jgi:hypothetical protein